MAITLVALLTLSSFGLLFNMLIPPVAANIPNLYTEGPFAMDATPDMMGQKEADVRNHAALYGQGPETGVSTGGEPAVIGTELDITVSDFAAGIDYDETFVVLMDDGIHGIICIEKAAYDAYNATTDEYVFPNPSGAWRDEDRISTAMLDYLLGEFDNNIYDRVAEVFGEPLPRGEEGQKTWILIHNIRDESYYDATQTSYIAGYFSAGEDAENQKNMFHMDTYDWGHRAGDADNEWFINDDAARPNLYEGTFAHEYEHLVHFDIDPDEPSWVDEGLADLSAFLCGYGHPDGHIWYYLAYHWRTPLTFWGGELQDYGASYLFQLYLYEKFGGESFVSDLVQEQANGIEGIENTLKKHHIWYPFDWIFDWWTIANYLDHPCIWQYGYDTLEMGSADTRGWTMDYSLGGYWGQPIFGFDTVPEWELQGWWGVPQPYTAHYYRFTTDKTSNVILDGEDFAGTTAYSGTYEWYSEADAWAWKSLYQTFAIPEGGATLDFMTYFDIEEDWDYGYVEVHDQDTGEWYTLDAAGTVDYVAHSQDNPNTPDEREPTAYETAGRWHGFTGFSGGWVPVSMNLTSFAGHNIDLYFTMWQDGAFTLQNMYVDDISIPELGFFDDVEAGEDGWTTTGWIRTDGIIDNGFGARILTLNYPLTDPEVPISLRWSRSMWMDSGTQSGKVQLSTSSENQIYLAIVTNHADHILPSDYVLSVEHKKMSWWTWWWHCW